tara:strand:+ start:296 stop:469 length:174 start_codon:yes stop_codon:yes gene_type:complete
MNKAEQKLAKKLGATSPKKSKRKPMNSDQLLDKHLKDLKDNVVTGRTNIGGVKTYCV